MKIYNNVLKKINFAAIVTTGRTGSDYLNSCLHGMDGVMTLNSCIFFFEKFYSQNKYIIKKNIKTKVLLNDFSKFYYKQLFKEDFIENKILNLDIIKFKKIFYKIYTKKIISFKCFFVAIHLAYHLLLEEKIVKKNLIIYHAHNIGELDKYLKFFPESLLLVTIRDPRDNLKSSLVNKTKILSKKNNLFFFRNIYRIFNDAFYLLKKYKQKKFFVKLETANLLNNKKKLCKFLKIKFNKKIFQATYGKSIPWIGDIFSSSKQIDGKYFLIKKSWKTYFFNYERFMLNFIFNNFKLFGYKFSKLNYYKKIIFLFILFLPFKFELINFLKLKNIKLNFYYYFQRVKFFLYILKKL